MRIIDYADPEEVEASLWEDVQGEVGWDIGANVGQSIKIMAAKFRIVHSFEPATECLGMLNHVAEQYGAQVWPIAVSDVDGTIDLVDIPDKIESGQLVSYEAAGMEYDPYQEGHALRTIESRTVDSLVRELNSAPDFMKIDVEGHEGKVIAGAVDTLSNFKPELLIEIHNREIGREIGQILTDLNYNVQLIRHPHYVPSRPTQAHLWDVHYWYKAK
jgi:FkbM family methyltransferase